MGAGFTPERCTGRLTYWEPKGTMAEMLADCTPGSAEEALYLQACEESLRTIKVAGPPSPESGPSGGMEILPGPPAKKH